MQGKSFNNVRFRPYWPTVVVTLLVTEVALSLTLKQGTFLDAYCESIFFILTVLACGVAIRNAIQNKETIRLFWSFLAVAYGLWALVPFAWLYYGLQGKIPSFLVETLPLSLHIVVIIAAVACRPHLRLPRQRPYRTTLNFLVLLFFLIFAYSYLLFPYQYAPGTSTMILRFEIFYCIENLVLLVILGMLISRSQPPWKLIYWYLFGASTLYALGSLAATIARVLRHPFSGVLIALPFTAAIGSFVWVALQGRECAGELAHTVQVDTIDTRQVSFLAMLAVVAIPVVGLFELFRANEPHRTQMIHLLIVLVSIVLLAVAAFIQDYLSNRELASDVGLANDRLTLAMESAKSVGWEWDLKSGQDSWFGDLETMFGIPSSTYLGYVEDFYRYIHLEDREQVSKAVNDSIRSHKQYAGEFRTVWPDGTVHYAAASGKCYYSPDGQPERMLGVAIDITERHRAEEAMRESEKRFRLVADTTPALIWMSDTDRLCTYFNKPWLDFTGRSMDSELGNGWADGVHPEDLRKCVDTYAKAFDRRQKFEMEYRLRRYDGEYRWVLDIGVPRFNQERSFVGYIGSGVDVTERKHAEEALRESEERFRMAAQAGKMFAYEWDAATDVIVRSGEFVQILGIDEEVHTTGEQVLTRVHPDDRKRLLAAVAALSAEKPYLQVSFRMLRPDGIVIWVERTSRAHFDEEGKMLRLVGMVTDITERKRAEETLANVSRRLIEAQEQERTRIARELHDDIGQRLAMLAVELEELRQNPPILPEIRSRMDGLQKQASEIATDIQTLSHELHSSKLQYLGIATAMRSFCKQFGEQQDVEIDFRSHDLHSSLPPDVSLCLFRVMQEALHNSAKHSGVRHVEVRLWETPDEIHLTVKDSGAGFDSEAAKQNRGLGLISMEERLKLVKGTFSIESQPKRGTTIHAHVPLSSGSDSMPVAS